MYRIYLVEDDQPLMEAIGQNAAGMRSVPSAISAAWARNVWRASRIWC